MSFARYALVVVVVASASSLLFWILAGAVLGPAAVKAWVAGASIAAANTLVAFGLVLWSSGRATPVFMGAVLGGMLARMGAMLAAVVASVLWLGLPKAPLTVSLLCYFVLFLVVELRVLHRRTSAPGTETTS